MAVATSVFVACKYTTPDGNSPTDGSTDGPPILPDAGPCAAVGETCFSDGSGGTVLQSCNAEGAQPTTEPCPWGCSNGGGAHCALLQPSGGALTPLDLRPVAGETLLPIAISADVTLDTNTGAISGNVRQPGAGVIDGISFEIRGSVGVFRFQSLDLTGELKIAGTNAVAIVSLGAITVDELIDVQGPCTATVAGPGGFAGAAGGVTSVGLGRGTTGQGVNDDSSGGGGGAHGAGGGSGGGGANQSLTAGGTAFGDLGITVLQGGGGGGGGGNAGGAGGGGGGAIQLVANGTITFDTDAEVNAGGCGGKLGGDKRGAGGGGAGGAILLEAPAIVFVGSPALAANGGGGGGGDNPAENASDGENGHGSATRAQGGNNGSKGGDGGDGAADDILLGRNGVTAENGGGGGGGVGWIRINTLTGMATLSSAVISPQLDAGTASLGVAVTQ